MFLKILKQSTNERTWNKGLKERFGIVLSGTRSKLSRNNRMGENGSYKLSV